MLLRSRLLLLRLTACRGGRLIVHKARQRRPCEAGQGVEVELVGVLAEASVGAQGQLCRQCNIGSNLPRFACNHGQSGGPFQNHRVSLQASAARTRAHELHR